MTTRVFKITLISKCSHQVHEDTCTWCAHLNMIANKLQDHIKNRCNTISSDLKAWKPLDIEEVLPKDCVEIQHESEYN